MLALYDLTTVQLRDIVFLQSLFPEKDRRMSCEHFNFLDSLVKC